MKPTTAASSNKLHKTHLSYFNFSGNISFSEPKVQLKICNNALLGRLSHTNCDSHKKVSTSFQCMWAQSIIHAQKIHLSSIEHLAEVAPGMQKGQQSWGLCFIWDSNTSIRLKGYFSYMPFL